MTSSETRTRHNPHDRQPTGPRPDRRQTPNMTGQWFGVLTRKLLRRGDFTSREDLETRITAFTIRHNKNARPYRWSYDADADHARYLERHTQHAAAPVLAEAA